MTPDPEPAWRRWRNQLARLCRRRSICVEHGLAGLPGAHRRRPVRLTSGRWRLLAESAAVAELESTARPRWLRHEHQSVSEYMNDTSFSEDTELPVPELSRSPL